jgi:cysteine desulfurase family protein
MIYFDNAATTRTKPKEVLEAFNYYVTEIGTSPGRGSYSLGIQASRMLYQSRKAVAKFFGVTNPENVVFTKNSTEGINFFFNGYLKSGDHVLISPYEHNAVLRPLHNLKIKDVIDYTVLPEEAIYDAEHHLEKYIRPNTSLVAITLASNLTGQIVFNKEISKITNKHHIKMFVDASQGAGKKLLNMQRDGIDVLAFTGHKDLMALPGVGGVCSQDALNIAPFIQGGTGIHGDEFTNPQAYPDAYEAGTLNMPAIWSLKTAIEIIEKNIKTTSKYESSLLEVLLDGLKKDSNIILYNTDKPRVSTICFNVKGVPSSDVVAYLDKHGVCVRGGIHCAILAHTQIGTVGTGAVRVSFNACNTLEEIEKFIQIIGDIKNALGIL